MHVRRSIAVAGAVGALAALGAGAATADTGTPPTPPTAATQPGKTDRQQQRQQRLEQRKQRLEARKQQLEQRKQEWQDQRQAAREQRQTAREQRGQAAGAKATRAQGRAGDGKGRVLYRFRGEVRTVSATSLALTVEGGNHAALRTLIGASVDATFAVGPQTEFLLWHDGVPTVVDASDVHVGDWVAVAIRAPRGADLDRLESVPAGIVSDLVTEPEQPDQPLYLFRGTVVSSSGSSVTVKVAGGNNRALRQLAGKDAEQTFAVGGETIVLDWQGKVPTVISATDLKAGQRVAVRVRADEDADLATVEHTAATRVGEHEPANG
jgi:hypothetical protein